MVNDAPAEAISDRIQQFHLLYDFISEIEFESRESPVVTGTRGNGDAALWTGCYLAAEAFRYRVTQSCKAFKYLQKTLDAVRALATVREADFLVRTIFPLSSPFLGQFERDEAHHGLFRTTYKGQGCYWPGHPTRDQYAGVLFGLGVTHDLVNDDGIRATCAETITLLVQGLMQHGWIMGSGNKLFQETYLTRPDHLLSALQVARHVNPSRFGSIYSWTRFFLAPFAGLPLSFDIGDVRRNDGHYYEFNVDYLYWHNLIKFEDSDQHRQKYVRQFARLRDAARNHLNAHFNMIDRVIFGPDADRDHNTVDYLSALLQRGFRSNYLTCPDQQTTSPAPIIDRPYADFLWQRSPLLVKWVSDGRLESPGIDYILPYWMARCYGIIA
jgi:hypothetical protein